MTTPSKAILRVAFVHLVMLIAAWWGMANNALARDGLAVEMLKIETGTAVRDFQVEVARTEQEKAVGLMFRRSLSRGRGMLFPYRAVSNLTMWMRNTYMPLDMIFIKADGKILRIAKNTEPLSEEIIEAGGAVKAVLEIAGGEADRLGISPGDLVRHPHFGTALKGQ